MTKGGMDLRVCMDRIEELESEVSELRESLADFEGD